MSEITKQDGKWLLQETQTINTQSSDVISHVLHTAGTYVDSDIEVKIQPQVKSGAQGVSTVNEKVVSPSVASRVDGTLIAANGVTTTTPNGGNYKTIKAAAAVSTGSVSTQPQVDTTAAGWISTGVVTGDAKVTTVTPTSTIGDIYYIPVVAPTVNVGTIDASKADNKITTDLNTSATKTPYAINAKATGKVTISGVSYSNKAGYVEEHTNEAIDSQSTIANINSEADTIYLAEGICTIEGGDLSLKTSNVDKTSQAVSITVDTTSNVKAEVVESAPADGSFYIPVNTETAAKNIATVTASRAAVTDAHTAGYIPAKEASTAIAATSTAETISINSGTSVKYIKVDKGSISAQVPEANAKDGEYAEVSTATVPYIPSGGNLYLEEGYYGKTKISLAQLVPNEATMVTATSTGIVVGQKAYNNDGNLIGGALGKINSFDFSGGAVTSTASVTSTTVGFADEDTGISITASAVAERGAVSYDTTLGYVKAATGLAALSSASSTSADAVYYISSLTVPAGKSLDITDNGTVNVSTSTTSTVKVGDVTVVDNGTVTKGAFNCIASGAENDFDISISTSTVSDGVVNAASGAATSTAPTEGVYIAVSTKEATSTVEAKASATKDGWIKVGDTVTSDKVNVTVESTTAYVPVKTTTFAASVDEASISSTAATSTASVTVTGATLATSAPAAGNYITIAPKVSASNGGSVTFRGAATVAESGWATAGTVYSSTSTITTASEAKTDNVNYYIPVYGGSID